jgi:23S rRNA pseudouridine2605 synthase
MTKSFKERQKKLTTENAPKKLHKKLTPNRSKKPPIAEAAAPTSSAAKGAIRLAKRLSDAGLCSRREAEAHILAGRVTVNNTTITTPAFTVTSKDYVKLDGVLVRNTPQQARLFLYHKPRGLLTTTRDTHDRPTVFDALPKGTPRLISVGRLDMDSEGLLLLTTSGALARTLELPQSGIPRTYRVRILGTLQPESIAKLARGMTVDGVQYGAISTRIEPATSDGRNRWVEVQLSEGKNREIRKVFAALGHTVSRLVRVSYGPFTLGKLPRATLMEVKQAEWQKALEKWLK